jgi:DNA-directed RNA polymerase sigma subunit (sigma70/sigma32)
MPAYICHECVELCAAIFEHRRMFEDDGQLNAVAKKMSREIDERLATLTSLEEDVIRLRNGLDDGISLSLDEIAQRLGMPPERVAEVEARANAKMRAGGPPS